MSKEEAGLVKRVLLGLVRSAVWSVRYPLWAAALFFGFLCLADPVYLVFVAAALAGQYFWSKWKADRCRVLWEKKEGEPHQWGEYQFGYIDDLIECIAAGKRDAPGLIPEHIEATRGMIDAFINITRSPNFKRVEMIEEFFLDFSIHDTFDVMTNFVARKNKRITRENDGPRDCPVVVLSHVYALQSDFFRLVEQNPALTPEERAAFVRADTLAYGFFGGAPFPLAFEFARIPPKNAYFIYAVIRFVLNRGKQYIQMEEEREEVEAQEQERLDALVPQLEEVARAAETVGREPDKGVFLGHCVIEAEDGKKQHPYWIAAEEYDRMHKYVIGTTGSGKTVFLTGLMLPHFQITRPHFANAAVIDLHGDITGILQKGLFVMNGAHTPGDVSDLFAQVSERFIFLDLADGERAPGLNLLAPRPDFSASQQANVLAEIMTQLYPGTDQAVRIRQIMLMTFTALIKAGKYTFLEIPSFLNNPDFREKVLREADDEALEDYFFDSYQGDKQYSSGFLARLTPFIYDPQFRVIFGQQQSTLDFEDILNTPRMLVVHAPKGKLGQARDLICSLLLSGFLMAAFSRGRSPESAREPYHMFLDEFQNYGSMGSIESMLTETRKYGVFLTLAHQNLSQTNITRNLSNVIRGNAGMHAYFSLDPNDAPLMAKEVFPRPTLEDTAALKAQPPGGYYLKIHGKPPLTMKADNLRKFVTDEFAALEKQAFPEGSYRDTVRECCFCPWTRPIDEIEREIKERRRAMREQLPALKETSVPADVDIDKLLGLR